MRTTGLLCSRATFRSLADKSNQTRPAVVHCNLAGTETWRRDVFGRLQVTTPAKIGFETRLQLFTSFFSLASHQSRLVNTPADEVGLKTKPQKQTNKRCLVCTETCRLDTHTLHSISLSHVSLVCKNCRPAFSSWRTCWSGENASPGELFYIVTRCEFIETPIHLQAGVHVPLEKPARVPFESWYNTHLA